MRPLPDVPSDPALEPRLELVPDVDEAEETEVDEAEDAEDEEPEDGEEDAPPAAKAEATQDPLKLYVRAIGDGPLLTPAEERELRQLAQKYNREPTEKELAKESGFPEKRVRELLDLVEDPVSLETPVGDGESMYADLIEDVHSERPDESTSKKLRRNELAEALLLLNPRMQRVLSLRFGLNGEPPQTLEEVGAGLGITRERVRQLESRALRELRAVAPDLELYLRT